MSRYHIVFKMYDLRLAYCASMDHIGRIVNMRLRSTPQSATIMPTFCTEHELFYGLILFWINPCARFIRFSISCSAEPLMFFLVCRFRIRNIQSLSTPWCSGGCVGLSMHEAFKYNKKSVWHFIFRFYDLSNAEVSEQTSSRTAYLLTNLHRSMKVETNISRSWLEFYLNLRVLGGFVC